MSAEAAVQIHPNARVSHLADLEPSTRGTRIIVEDGAVIDSFVKIKPVGGVGDVRIGARSVINSGCVIYSGNGVEIGADCAIAANCVFAPVNHAFWERGRLIREQRFAPSKGGVRLGDDVWVGAGVVLLDGSLIEDGCVVGAGSLVRGRLEAYGVYGGNPLRKLGERR